MAMPFVKGFKVCLPHPTSCIKISSDWWSSLKKQIAQFGAQIAFRCTLPFSESIILVELVLYLKKTLSLVDADIIPVDKARTKEGQEGYTKSIIDSSEPGNPTFEYRNVYLV